MKVEIKTYSSSSSAESSEDRLSQAYESLFYKISTDIAEFFNLSNTSFNFVYTKYDPNSVLEGYFKNDYKIKITINMYNPDAETLSIVYDYYYKDDLIYTCHGSSTYYYFLTNGIQVSKTGNSTTGYITEMSLSIKYITIQNNYCTLLFLARPSKQNYDFKNKENYISPVFGFSLNKRFLLRHHNTDSKARLETILTFIDTEDDNKLYYFYPQCLQNIGVKNSDKILIAPIYLSINYSALNPMIKNINFEDAFFQTASTINSNTTYNINNKTYYALSDKLLMLDE